MHSCKWVVTGMCSLLVVLKFQGDQHLSIMSTLKAQLLN